MNNLKIVIPSYEQLCSMNKEREYKGLEFRVHIVENLYLLIEFRNENLMFLNGQSKIYVAWCTHNGFPIATETYINCKEGYDEAIKFLFQTAEKFENTFRDFFEKYNCCEVKKMDSYNLEYKDVLCKSVDWETYTFVLVFRGKEYVYKQQGDISCSADTDHIRCVIEEFKTNLMTQFFEENFDKE